MTDWTAGYVADIGYLYGYYPELNPLRMKLAFANAGVVCPQVGTACELGFGQGLSANLHAAASVVRWYGNDFNPAQASFAQELAAASGVAVQLHDDAFTEFAQRPDLPEFDYIGLHGIWSWINDENRHCIVDFVRRKLKVGGVLYVSYNTMPGWASFAPMRHLLARHAEVMGSDGPGIARRIDGALAFADALMATDPLYLKANPLVRERMQFVKGQSRQYLAHEFFNRDWHPMPFSSMAEWLAPAKLEHACPASLLDQVDSLNLSEAQRSFLRDIPDAGFRESVRDFMVNQQFRKDYWVKGLRRTTPLQQMAQLRAQRVMLTAHRPDVALKVKGARGEASANASVYVPVLDLLADHQPRTIGALEQATSLPLNKVVVCVSVLIGMGHAVPVQDDSLTAACRAATDRLNTHLMDPGRGIGEIGHLASPVSGGGAFVDRFSQLFLQSRARGRAQPEEWAADAWQLVSTLQQRLLKDGKPIETAQENQAELTRRAHSFAEKELPVLKALQIAPA